jgi:hypothetical protein
MLILLVGLALGFCAGLLLFNSPIDGTTTGVTDIEDRLLRNERRAGATADSARCRARQAGRGREYLCEVFYGITGGTVDDIRMFEARVSDSGTISFRPRDP